MSNFNCEYCDTPILEGEGGHYITSCKHYPLESRNIAPIYAQNKIRDEMIKSEVLYREVN